MIVTKDSALKFLSNIHIPGLSGISARQDDDEQWREKLVALLEGMECENIQELIVRGKIGDYRKLGECIAERIGLLRDFFDDCREILKDRVHEDDDAT